MERPLLEKIARHATLLTLPLAATLGACSETSEKDQSTVIVSSPTPSTEQSTKQMLKDAAKAKGLGIVFVEIENYEPDGKLELRLMRVDDKADPNDKLNNQTMIVNHPLNVLGASSCDGEYSLSFSIDGGETFKTILNGSTPDQPLTPTFRLDSDCSIDRSLLFVRPSSNTQ